MNWTIWQVNGEKKYLSADEVRRFIQTARGRRLDIALLCEFLAVTGCRISEAISMTCAQVSPSTRLATIHSLKKRKPGVFREVPLTPALAEGLNDYIEAQSLKPHDKLWPYSRMTAYRHVKAIMMQIGIDGPRASPKALRHGFAIEAIQAGVPLNIVQRWLGHASMATTAIYTSAIGPEELKLADRMWSSRTSDAQSERQELSNRMAARRESIRTRTAARSRR